MSEGHRTGRGSAAGRRPVPADQGAVAVEMAFVLPVLLLIVFGVIDFGRMMNQQITLTEAAREGARVGALNGTVTQVKTKVNSIVGVGVTLTYTGGTPTVCSTASAGTADSFVRVQRTFDPVTPLSGLITLFGGPPSGTVTLTAVGGMTCIG